MRACGLFFLLSGLQSAVMFILGPGRFVFLIITLIKSSDGSQLRAGISHSVKVLLPTSSCKWRTCVYSRLSERKHLARVTQPDCGAAGIQPPPVSDSSSPGPPVTSPQGREAVPSPAFGRPVCPAPLPCSTHSRLSRGQRESVFLFLLSLQSSPGLWAAQDGRMLTRMGTCP